MNTLQISTHVKYDPNDNPTQFVFTSVLVDNQPIIDYDRYGVATDILELWKSSTHDGEFFIITCTCGDTGCADIQQGIRVYRDTKNVNWVIRGFGPTQTFMFEAESYRVAIEKGIKQLRQMIAQHDFDLVPETNRHTLQEIK